MITEGKARPSLTRRVAVANKRGADLFLSIHHDSVPDIYNESWEFEGKKRHFNDLFAGYSVFVSQQNPHYRESLRFAKLVGNEMASQDLKFARQYDQWFMGKYQRELLDQRRRRLSLRPTHRAEDDAHAGGAAGVRLHHQPRGRGEDGLGRAQGQGRNGGARQP